MPRKKTCKHCEKKYVPRDNAGSFERWCSADCAFELANSALERKRANAKANEAKKLRAEKKQTAKEKLELKRKDLSRQKRLTQKVFNKMRVIEEKLWYYRQGLQPVCISCNKPNMDWCCGHFKSRGSFPELALDPLNTWLQCNYYCNKSLSANINGNKTSHGYIAGLKLRLGEEDGQAIIDYLEVRQPAKKWAWQDFEVFRAVCSKQVAELEQELSEYEP